MIKPNSGTRLCVFGKKFGLLLFSAANGCAALRNEVRQNQKADGGDMARPRAADDFDAIRTRMAELRRERQPTPSAEDSRPPLGPRPYAAGTDRAGMSLVMHRMLQRTRT
jgi:hypothetical protein